MIIETNLQKEKVFGHKTKIKITLFEILKIEVVLGQIF